MKWMFNLSMGFMTVLAAALGIWDAAAGGLGVLVTLNALWWLEERRAKDETT